MLANRGGSEPPVPSRGGTRPGVGSETGNVGARVKNPANVLRNSGAARGLLAPEVEGAAGPEIVSPAAGDCECKLVGTKGRKRHAHASG